MKANASLSLDQGDWGPKQIIQASLLWYKTLAIPKPSEFILLSQNWDAIFHLETLAAGGNWAEVKQTSSRK